MKAVAGAFKSVADAPIGALRNVCVCTILRGVELVEVEDANTTNRRLRPVCIDIRGNLNTHDIYELTLAIYTYIRTYIRACCTVVSVKNRRFFITFRRTKVYPLR